MKNSFLCLSCFIVLCFTGLSANANVIAEDGFGTSGLLDGHAGGSGWTDAWGDSSGTGVLAMEPDSLSYASGSLLTSGGKMQVPAGALNALELRQLSLQDSGTVWASMLLQVNGSGISDNYVALAYMNSDNGSLQDARIWIGLREGQLKIQTRDADDAWVTVTPADYTHGDTALIVVRFRFGAGTGGTDVVDFWMNPLGTEPLVTEASHVLGVSDIDAAFDGVRLSGTSDSFPNYADEIRIGTGYTDVVPLCASDLLLNGDFSEASASAADHWDVYHGDAGSVGVYFIPGVAPEGYLQTPLNDGPAASLKSNGDNYIQQELNGIFADFFDSYTLSFSLGYRYDTVTNGDIPIRVSIWNTTDNVELSGYDIVIPDPGETAGQPPQGQWGAYEITLPVDTAGVSPNGQVAVRFTNTNANWVSYEATALIDNIRLYLPNSTLPVLLVYPSNNEPKEPVDAAPTLEWTSGTDPSIVQHVLYFSTDENWVNTALPTDIGAVILDVTEETYQHPSALEYETNYFWRVDEVRGSLDNPDDVDTGPVWSFTTEPIPTMQWALAPVSIDRDSIRMVASDVYDDSPVEYYFTCISDSACDSSWQDSREYIAEDLIPGQKYTFSVKSRLKTFPERESALASPVAVWLYHAGDLNLDGRVTLTDLHILALNWLGYIEGEVVDIAFFAKIQAAWLANTYSLDAFWPMDLIENGCTEDISGNGNPATLVGDPVLNQTAGIDGAIALDGIDDGLLIENYPAIQGGESRTCLAWIKTDKPSANLFDWGDLSGRWNLKIDANGKIRLDANGGYVVGETLLTDNEWHHIAVVLPESLSPQIEDVVIYVDGIEEQVTEQQNAAVNTSYSQDTKLCM